jgi:hypothetical protein
LASPVSVLRVLRELRGSFWFAEKVGEDGFGRRETQGDEGEVFPEFGADAIFLD